MNMLINIHWRKAAGLVFLSLWFIREPQQWHSCHGCNLSLLYLKYFLFFLLFQRLIEYSKLQFSYCKLYPLLKWWTNKFKLVWLHKTRSTLLQCFWNWIIREHWHWLSWSKGRYWHFNIQRWECKHAGVGVTGVQVGVWTVDRNKCSEEETGNNSALWNSHDSCLKDYLS